VRTLLMQSSMAVAKAQVAENKCSRG
jgi:hypothetical protein